MRLSDVALSDAKGTSSFNYVISNPAYSGFVKRRYDRPHEADTTITVRTNLLDDLIDPGDHVSVIKVDVEGGGTPGPAGREENDQARPTSGCLRAWPGGSRFLRR